MTYHYDTRWRIVCLMHCYDMDVDFLHDIFGPSPRSIRRWYQLFITKGVVDEQEKKQTKSRWPEEVLQAVANYCKKHPTFYLEELQDFLMEKFDLKNISLATICRALNHDLKLSRKVLTKAASEAAPLKNSKVFPPLG